MSALHKARKGVLVDHHVRMDELKAKNEAERALAAAQIMSLEESRDAQERELESLRAQVALGKAKAKARAKAA